MRGISTEAIIAVIKRPDLWRTGIRSAVSMAPTGWWRSKPFLPMPDDGWMHFRLETAYGGEGDQPMRSEDLITWLEWKRDLVTP